MQIEYTLERIYGVKTPEGIIVGLYRGEIDNRLVFANRESSRNPLYLIVEDGQCVFKEGVITPIDTQPSSIILIPGDKIHEMKDGELKSGLIKMLNKAKIRNG